MLKTNNMDRIIGNKLEVVESTEIGWANIDSGDVDVETMGGDWSGDVPNYVFLGGTCAGSTWRDDLILLLEAKGIHYFNPVVEDWTPECVEIESHAKENAAYELYVITSDMAGVYSIAEATAAACSEKNTIFMVMESGFDNHQMKSLVATANLIAKCGGTVCYTLEEVVELLEK